MDKLELRDALKELIAMFREETGEDWNEMLNILDTCGVDEFTAENIIDELKGES